VPRPREERETLRLSLSQLPPGTEVALAASGFAASRRCRSLAAGAGLEVDREYLPYPSLDGPLFLVEDDPGAIDFFWSNLITVPPGMARAAFLADALLAAVRRIAPWGFLRGLTPGRVLLAHRS